MAKIERTKVYKDIKNSLIEELNKQGKTAKYFMDMADDYMKYYVIKERLQEDIDKNGPRITCPSSTGKMVIKDNKSYAQLINVSKIMINILTTLGIDQTDIEEDVEDDYM